MLINYINYDFRLQKNLFLFFFFFGKEKWKCINMQLIRYDNLKNSKDPKILYEVSMVF